MEMILDYQAVTNKEFDIVVKYRADIMGGVIPIPSQVQENTIYIPETNYRSPFNDQIGYGNVHSMIKYCSLTDKIYTYCRYYNVLYHPEMMLKYHLGHEKLNIIRVPYDYQLVRPTGYDG
jgi:hypothetical protein